MRARARKTRPTLPAVDRILRETTLDSETGCEVFEISKAADTYRSIVDDDGVRRPVHAIIYRHHHGEVIRTRHLALVAESLRVAQ